MNANLITVEACRQAAPKAASSLQDDGARKLPTVLGLALALCVSVAMWAGLIVIGIQATSLL